MHPPLWETLHGWFLFFPWLPPHVSTIPKAVFLSWVSLGWPSPHGSIIALPSQLVQLCALKPASSCLCPISLKHQCSPRFEEGAFWGRQKPSCQPYCLTESYWPHPNTPFLEILCKFYFITLITTHQEAFSSSLLGESVYNKTEQVNYVCRGVFSISRLHSRRLCAHFPSGKQSLLPLSKKIEAWKAEMEIRNLGI